MVSNPTSFLERHSGLRVILAAFFSFGLLLGMTWWSPWDASAAVSESALVDLATLNGTTKLKPGSTTPLIKFTLAANSSEQLASTTFKINNVSGFTTADFNTDSALLQGAALMLVKDSNTNGVYDSGGGDTVIGAIMGSNLTLATTTITVDSDGNFGNGVSVPDTISSAAYFYVLILSSTSTNNHAFNMAIAPGTASYTVTSTAVTSAGLTTASITIDNVAPTAGSVVPADGQENAPVETLVKRTFSEALASATVSTTAVYLLPNAGNTQGGAPSGTNLCTTATLGDTNTSITCAHVNLAVSTWYSFVIASTTSDIAGNTLAANVVSAFKTGSFSPDNNVTPPFVVNTLPVMGKTDFPTNGKLVVEFPSSAGGVMATTGAGSVTSSDNILLQEAVNGVPTGPNLLTNTALNFVSAGVNGQHALFITPSSALSGSISYILTIKNTTKNVQGVALNNNFILSFKTAAGTDSTPPTFLSMMPANAATGVALNVADVVVQFSEEMAGSTMTVSNVRFFKDSNSNSTLDGGESMTASTSLRYEVMQKAVHVSLSTILLANTRYCVSVTTSVTDSIGNAATAAVKCFTTTATAFSATAPKMQFADGDNFKIWVAYDQPIDATDAVTKANYTVESPVSVALNLTNATLTYRPEGKGVEITNVGLVTGQQFKVTVTGVRDLSQGATITANGTDNVAQGIIQSATSTGGLVGGLDKPDFNNTNFGTFWEKPSRCNPASTGASKTGRMMCEFPVPAALATGAKIILTMPAGFGINAASVPTAASSPMNADLNGPGPGVTTISAIVTSTAANTITLTLAHTGTAMGSSDQLRLELDTITNPSGSGSNSVSIIVKDASGVKQGQTINAAPFTINVAGSYLISGKVCKGTTSGGACGVDDTGIQSVKVFLDSPASGHLETTTDSDGAYSFTGLSAGNYNIGMFIDPTIAPDIGGGNNFQNITVVGANVTGVHFRKANVSATGKTMTIAVSGGPASTDMEVFCFAPNNVQSSAPVSKKLTTNGSGVASGSLKLQPNTTYQCGLGPYIPFDSRTSGSAPTMPTFSFVPPPQQTVVVTSTATNLAFALTLASQQIIGKVTDGSGTAIANVFVDARPTGCFDSSTGALKDCKGSRAQSKSDGTFTLNVTQGTYQVGACAPGMPCSSPTEVTVKSDTSNSGTDSNSAADVYSGGTLLTGVGVTVKLSKSNVTISGQVLDESSNAIKYAFVQARKVTSGDTCTAFTSTGGDAGSPTDSSGNYTLYVSNGTWRVEAFAGTYGQVNCSIIVVSSATSKTGQNIQAETASYGIISGTVSKASTATQGAQVNCFGSAGGNQTISGADGTYSIKVKAGTYRCEGFLPGAGPLTPVTDVVVTTTASIANLVIGNPGTITVALGSTVTDAYCDARSTTGQGMGTGQNSSGTYTLNVPAGSYTVRCGNPKIGEIGSEAVTVTAGGSNTVTFTAPTLFTVSGRVTDGSSNLEGASVTLTDKTNGRIIFKQSDATSGSSANASISIPAGTYSVVSNKAGYVDSGTAETLVVSANTSFTARSLTKATASAAITVQASSANYTGEARVIATRTSDSKVVVVDVDETDSSGANTTLPLTDGTWSIKAVGDNGKESAATTITVSGGVANSSPTLSLSEAITGFTSSTPKQQQVTPSEGGLFKDTNISSSFEVSIPTGALSTSDSTAGTLETKANATLAIDTPGKDFLGTSAIDITPKNSSGEKITELATAATIKIPYDPTLIPTGVSETDLLCGTWSDASGEWETLATTVDTTNNILTCQTTHFSTFGAIAGTSGGATASSESSSPSSSSGGGGGGSVVVPVLPTLSKGAAAWVKVNNGVTESKTRLINLNFAVEGATQMAISNDPKFTGVSYRAYKSSTAWELTPGNGLKTVYVRFRSNTSGTVDQRVTITLNSSATEIAPVVSKPVSAPNVIVPLTGQFTKDLKVGSSKAEVMALQLKLQELGYLDKKITANGVYGSATTAAVKKFQKASKLSQTGTVGPQTRAVLNKSASAPVVTVTPMVTETKPTPVSTRGQFTKDIKPGSAKADIMALQVKLQALGYLDSKITANGLYGPATTAAVKKLQKANKLSQLGTVGPGTRAVLNAK